MKDIKFKYVIRNNEKNHKDMYFGGWNINKGKTWWYNRGSEGVFRFGLKSIARGFAKRLTEEGHKVKIVKLKRNEWA